MIPSNLALTYDHVVLSYPKYSKVESRTECSTVVQLGNHTFDLPIIPANMKCVISNDLGYRLMENGYFHIMHRFGHVYDDLYEYYHRAHNENLFIAPHYYSSISVGVKGSDAEFLERIASRKLTPDYITIDVAHGHHSLVLDMVRFIKSTLDWDSQPPFVIAGNIATPNAVLDLQDAGVDAVKVGIGPGKACTTYIQTGFMSPMFTTIQRCAEVARIPIIADGGIRTNGDIAKALVAGATMVMAGSIFSECWDSPAHARVPILNAKNIKSYINSKLSAQTNYIPPVYSKEFYGSASQFNKGHGRNIEGKKINLKGNGLTVLEKMEEIKQSLQSSISYAGGTNLNAFNNVKYDVIL